MAKILLHNTLCRYYCFCAVNEQLKKNALVIQLIEKHTIIDINHLTPEIRLHLITPECSLWNSRANESPFNDPYWAFYWPGGQAISRYILDNPSIVQNLNVVDIGCGSGACSIAASLSGAKQVIANDIDDVACTSVALNASLNNAHKIYLCRNNLLNRTMELQDADCILIGDMFYNEEFSGQLINWILYLQQLRKTILIGDPGRLAFKCLNLENKVRLLAEYTLPQNACLENNGYTTANVWMIC